MKKLIVLCLLISLVIQVQAQAIYKLKFRFEPTINYLQKQAGNWIDTDSLGILNRKNEVLLLCYEQSYFLANNSSQEIHNDSISITIQLNQSFKLTKLRPGNLPLEWVEAAGPKLFGNPNKPFQSQEISKGMQQILSYAQNNGYPFASISLDSIIIDTLGVNASINLQKNSLTFFDSIDFGGTARMKKSFLQNYANIKPGMIYQEDALKNLDSRLSELSYVQVVRPLGVYFYGNKAKPYVYIDSKKASSFDGVIGFAPNSSLNNKLVVTGDLNLKLVNLIGSGKNLELAYRGFLNSSQDLQAKFLYPYFLNSKVAIEYAFKLLKFDTSWFELVNDIAFQYRFTGNNYVKFFYQNQLVNLLQVDTQFVLSNKKLPSNHDVRNDLYGLGLRRSTLNYFYNPSKGYLLELEAGAGTKRISKNSTIQDLVLSENGINYSIYDSVNLKTIQFKGSGNLMVFNKLASHFVLLTQLKGGIVSNENLFLNELFRIGGLKTLKGFDEQSIFASKYLIANVELRYLFQQNSGFMVFWNGAWYKNEAVNPQITDKPWGVGAGMNLETGAGIFSLYYALGTQKGNPLEFQRAKVHFGLVNFF
ncbi:MAG: hypothetical protein CFE21_07830 [Bacteroidetes bacterium B1(2017)]|nr:MAG: hypothetical protein CFE21_07830 [Bacteroidetes bacterium B1(2017)]